MQTYSIGFGGSLFPKMNHAQQAQVQAKPYASLKSYDVISLSNESNVKFGAGKRRLNDSEKRKELEEQCLSVGLTQSDIDEKREKLRASLKAKGTTGSSMGGKLNTEMLEWLRSEYEKRRKKVEVDGPEGRLEWRNTGFAPDPYFWQVQSGKR